MADLDEELLGLVGDDDSGDEESVDDFERLEQAELGDLSGAEEPQPSVEKVDDAPERRKGVAQKVRAKRGKRKVRQPSEDEDDAASATPGSPEYGLYDEEDDDAPGEEEEDIRPLYPLEGKYESEQDRSYVMALSEIQREELLATRAEEVTRRTQDQLLKKALASSSAANKQKRKAAAADLEDNNNRRTTRPKTEKQLALDRLRQTREEKAAQRDRLAITRDDRRDERAPSSHGSEKDADGESEVEWAAEPERKDDPPAELKDFDRARIGRTGFAKVCFYPGFEQAIRGCFARVAIGQNRETGQTTYRMCQIKDFTVGKPYQMENSAGKAFTTDQYALVAQGSSEKPWPFSACSDGHITDADYGRYVETLNKENMKKPSRRFLHKKLDDINGLLNITFTEEKLNQKFAKQREIQMKYDPVHQAKQKRKDIQRRRAEAEQNSDEEEIARCDAELEALENGAVNGGPKIVAKVKAKDHASPAKTVAQHESLAILNRQNRAKNQQEVRQALLKERQKIERERKAAHEKKTAEIRAQVHAKAKDQAQRRASQNKELFGEDTPGTSRAGTPANGTSTPKRRPDLPVNGAKGPIGALKKKNLDDEVISGLDLDIDIEI
ncbi:putative Plus-3 domain, Plus3-like superfamily protein [Septoria linicola]|nr:putative Plus-3 domain, Plus3-like superfamily protein [Septoria linicola]